MSTDVVLEDGESIDAEPDDLALYAAEFRWADTQARAWLKRKHFAGLQIELHQEGLALEPRPRSESYGSALAPISWYVTVPTRELADVGLDQDDMTVLIANSLGFDFAAIDPGLRGNKPKRWEPTTVLGETLKDLARRVPYRAGHIFEQIAEES